MTATGDPDEFRTYEEWGVVYGVDGDAGSGPVEGAGLNGYDERASAEEMLQWLGDSALVRRTVRVGPWKWVNDEEEIA